MEHARKDYADIQQIITNGTVRHIPFDEPVFLIRGQDKVAGDAVRAWAALAEKVGAASDILETARNHAAKMDAWPKKKIPDMKRSDAPAHVELAELVLSMGMVTSAGLRARQLAREVLGITS